MPHGVGRESAYVYLVEEILWVACHKRLVNLDVDRPFRVGRALPRRKRWGSTRGGSEQRIPAEP